MSLSGPVSGHHYVDVRAQQVWSKSMAPLESLLTYWKTKKLDSSEVPAAFTFQLRSQFAINLFHFLGEFCLKENRGRDSWGFFHTFFSFVAWKKIPWKWHVIKVWPKQTKTFPTTSTSHQARQTSKTADLAWRCKNDSLQSLSSRTWVRFNHGNSPPTYTTD